MRLVTCYDDFLDVRFYFVISNNETQADRYFAKRGCEGLDEDKEDEGSEAYCVIWKNRAKNNAVRTFCGIYLRENYKSNDLIHELIHAVFSIFARKQVSLDVTNDECFARYMDKLCHQLTQKGLLK